MQDVGQVCGSCHNPLRPLGPPSAARPWRDPRTLGTTGRGPSSSCREYHDPIVQGDGAVRRERCHSCHGEAGHIERFGETAFLHQTHVTDHKVECFECHDEIRHGLLPLDTPQVAAAGEGCGACHVTPHDAPALLYAGQGAVGVEDAPSRMYETRVVCAACHTGRSGYRHGGEVVAEGGVERRAGAKAASAPGAGHGADSASASAGHAGDSASASAPDAGHAAGGAASAGARGDAHRAQAEPSAHDPARGEGRPHGVSAAHGAIAAHAGLAGASHGLVAAAGAVDCIHCHGTGFAGMLAGWQATVGAELDRLQPLVARLGAALPEDDAELRRLHEEARRNVELVAADGSRGAHNVDYALAALRAAAERVDAGFARLDPETDVAAAAGSPFHSAHGCSSCHLGLEQRTVPVHGRAFAHASHLVAGLDCDACHALEPPASALHGVPAFPRTECATCHHAEESELGLDLDPEDCAACHEPQTAFLAGELEGFAAVPGTMADKECSSCHGSPPDLMIPEPSLCVLCHEEGYDETLERWGTETDASVAELERALTAARARGADPTAIAAAERALATLRADGSRGVHNAELARELLETARAGLE